MPVQVYQHVLGAAMLVVGHWQPRQSGCYGYLEDERTYTGFHDLSSDQSGHQTEGSIQVSVSPNNVQNRNKWAG